MCLYTTRVAHTQSSQGGDCYSFFLQWGLPKPTLKLVWDVVAGNQGFLTAQQFVSCLYLMENAKKVGFLAAIATVGHDGCQF